jgi:hypothetical protein
VAVNYGVASRDGAITHDDHWFGRTTLRIAEVGDSQVAFAYLCTQVSWEGPWLGDGVRPRRYRGHGLIVVRRTATDEGPTAPA